MSKRKSIGAANTLFNYFAKSPPPIKKAKLDADSGSSQPNSTLNGENDAKNKSKTQLKEPSPPLENSHRDSDEEIPISGKKKRHRIGLYSDDSDTDNQGDNKRESPNAKVTVEKKLQESFKYTPNQSPKQSKTPVSKPSLKPAPPEKVETPVADEENWIHCKLEWLKPHMIRDARGRRPDDQEYDPSTLYVPQDFLKAQTPAHRQWWEMKGSHFDCVLFFKVGKFYELYHMDAAVGVNELGFSYMKGVFAHSGFPESAYARMVSTLVSKGYKVARVEQTETPEMMKERCKQSNQMSKSAKVVRREICQVTVRGTQVCGLQDNGPSEAEAAYMVAIAEEENKGYSTYGICFVDASIGLFHLGQFRDDKHSSRLLTTLAHYPPALIIYDRKSTTLRTCKLLSSHWHSARREGRAIWPPEKTLKTLAEKYYKINEDGDWPEGLKEFLHQGDALGLTPAANCSLAIKALGGCVSYLTECLLDIQVLSMSQFTSHTPPDGNYTISQEEKQVNKWYGGNTMVLDSITLRNLRIVQNEGCLYDKLNFCSTNMGKRLLYQWVCSPSCNLSVIKERQLAVKELFEDHALCKDAKSLLTTLPDLERLLAKVHALGNQQRSLQHPDSRAIFYEEKIYSKRKVLDFLTLLEGFTAALKIVALFADIESTLLKRVMQLSPNGKFPDCRDTLNFFKGAFDKEQAMKEGRLLPGEGVDQEYDRTLKEIQEIEEELRDYLAQQEKYFRCRLSYVGSDKKRYQLEVPQSVAGKAGHEYHFEGARKGYKRFSTPETRELRARMISVEERKTTVLKDLSRRIFEIFSKHYSQWEAAVQCVATLDVLLAFAEFARQQSGDVCLPDVTFDINTKPYIKITEGRHPCIPIVNDFIPNDTTLGGDEASLLLLTGPNMGGKSTLMRQVGLLTVLAHLGSYVPAQECSLSLVDRVFTRVGASDDILSGQSTFLVEMNETSAIVKHATIHSLVLLDELGRGTSTYDGTAIASGVCSELASRGCRVLFSTHYHSLVQHLASHPGVILGHMACMVETDESPNNEDNTPEETITFLYKLTPGACPKSYGFNAAKLAGIPKNITRRAQQISKSLEKETARVYAFRDLMKKEISARHVREILTGLTVSFLSAICC